MSRAIVVLSHDFSWSASMPVPSLSYVTATAPRGKEAVGLSLSFNAARTNGEKPFLFKLQGLLSRFFAQGSRFLFPSPCELHHVPGNLMMSFFLRGFIGIPHEATCCWFDHVSGPCVPLRPWASPSRFGVTLRLPGTQQSSSSLVLTALTSVSHSWEEVAWHPGPV